MEKYGFVYIWYDRKHKRFYIGSHWGTEDDGYVCSSSWMKQAYRIRPEDFKRRIIFRCNDKKTLLAEENRILQMIKPEEISIKYYNLRISEFGHWSADKDLSETTRQRISAKTKEAMQRPEVKEKYFEGIKTRNHRQDDPEIRQKKSESMKKTMAEKFPNRKVRAKIGSPERSEFLSEHAKKMWSNPEHKEKVGKKISEAHKGKKFRAGHKNSAEHNKAIADSNIQRMHERAFALKDQILETMHLTAVDASKIIGIGRGTLSRYRSIINNL